MDTLPFIIICVCILAGIIIFLGTRINKSDIRRVKYANNADIRSRTEKKSSDLSSVAEQILLAGSKGPIPEITVKEIIGGAFYINTYGKKFGTLDPREKSENAAAIEELLNNELIKQKRKDVYSLTANGIKLAKKIFPL